ncbi:50S ribosomal protein L24e [Candidatus Woesearchaeota archaeon]|nr:50S ribosomal protein L24e [Candidatus Woesearchaeota archaeon]
MVAICTFCGSVLQKGTGTMFVRKDGRIQYFCSHKCEMNLVKLDRKPRETSWTFTAHKVKRAEKQ